METEEKDVEEETMKWEQVLRKMLPAGAPLPDQDHLDYSIAVEYQGPPLPYDVPRVDPLTLDSLSVHSPSFATSLSPNQNSVPVLPPITNPKISNFTSFKNIHSSTSSPLNKLSNGLHDTQSDQEKRAAAVTFQTPADSDTEDDGGGDDDGYLSEQSSAVATDGVASQAAVKAPRGLRKRGLCSRCGKKNRFNESEACLVCDSRYCRNCLLKAMGSMPEGRKCVGCIGRPIDESKRPILGKCSRNLAKVCSPLEIRQIMKAEKKCAANQLRPEQLIVNGRHLTQEELAEVLGCPKPPQKLKPGRYWYDKDSGLWGKVSKL